MTSEPRWGYAGAVAPEHWADLEPAYGMCRTGRRQSPIDLSVAIEGHPGDLALSYHLSSATFVDTFRTLAVRPGIGGLMSYAGRRYDLVELHFHAPAEHAIDGWLADLEAHWVHQSTDGATGVVGVLFTEDPGDHAIDQLVSTIPETPGGSFTTSRMIDLQRSIPVRSRRWRYEGSRTIPPCDEGIAWIVMEQIQGVDPSALRAFSDRYAPNNRSVQPLNDRTVVIG